MILPEDGGKICVPLTPSLSIALIVRNREIKCGMRLKVPSHEFVMSLTESHSMFTSQMVREKVIQRVKNNLQYNM